MTEEEKYQSGVDSDPAAGDQEEEINFEEILFGDDDETGVDEEGAADPEVETEQGEGEEAKVDQTQQQGDQGKFEDEKTEEAFAKRLSAEREKIREELRSEIMGELQQRTQTTPEQQRQGAPVHRKLTTEELEKMAEEFETSPKVMQVLYQQQQLINQQQESARRQAQLTRDEKEKIEAQGYAQEMQQKNPSLPAFDDKKLHQYRMDYYKKYGGTLPWKEAYRAYIADSVVNGDLTRQAQQETIQQITKRDKASVGPKSPASRKLDVNDLPPDQFERLVEEAKMGKYKRSE